MFNRSTANDEATVVRAGHWTDADARTGCTVLLFDRPAPAVVDVRGGAPGTRETDLLDAGALVRSVDAILLTGGSAFGLDAAGGVMRFLREGGQGVPTPGGPVPIVPTAVLFDLGVGRPVWPTADDAYGACLNARPLIELARGQVGAGTGATIRKVFPAMAPLRGGLGLGRIEFDGDSSVTAIVALNAAGDVINGPNATDLRHSLLRGEASVSSREATTLAAVIVDAPVDYRALHRAATAAHAALARMIRPSHTIFDGDTVFAVALRTGDAEPASVLRCSIAVELAVERAIIDAVTA